MQLATMRHCPVEWSLSSGHAYADPFNEVELWAEVTEPDGALRRVPAFWAGEQNWTFRYASPLTGQHRFTTVCSDTGNAALHGHDGSIEVTEYDGANPLFVHDALRVAADHRHFEHADGTPFFWLADTWWMCLTDRLAWPDDFQLLTADRVEKGFSVIQLVAGLYPDMPPFDPRGANAGGQAWTDGFAAINPAYFDAADLKIQWLVRSGLMPCIFGAWGYYLHAAGIEGMKKHWRYLVARYGAYPVVWCAAGEATWWLSNCVDWTPEERAAYECVVESIGGEDQCEPWARAGWTEVIRDLRAFDPYHRLITIHPAGVGFGREMVDDASLIDFELLQTGHDGWREYDRDMTMLADARARTPTMPVINGEVDYEGIGGGCGAEIQRFLFWTSLLGGAAGHTYGANGIWQFNAPQHPFGPSPRGGQTWGLTPWEDAYRLPGSHQVGLGRKLLEELPWQRFEPHPEWLKESGETEPPIGLCCAGTPGEIRIIYLQISWTHRPVICDLEPNVRYRAYHFDPLSGECYDLGDVVTEPDRSWRPPSPYVFQDMILVLQAQP